MEIQKLCHRKFGEIRVLLLNGKFYFLAKDAADVLKFRDTSQAIRQHVAEQDKFCSVKLTGQTKFGDEKIPHNALWINESGLYSLVLHSTLPAAKEFQHWVTAEVLPSIREKGYYINPYAPTAPKIAPAPVPENELNRLDKIKILRELLDYTDCKQIRNRLIVDIAYWVTGR